MTPVLLVCHVSSKIGMGHLSRLIALAETLKKDNKAIPEFLIFGDCVKKGELTKFKVHSFSLEDDFIAVCDEVLINNDYSAVIFDLYLNHNIENLNELFKQHKQRNVRLIGIDAMLEHCNILDLIWIPAFNFDFSRYAHCNSMLKSGWDSLLIQKRLEHKDWSPGSKVLILTGGSDVAKLGVTLPSELDSVLDEDTDLHWVRGPFSDAPILPNQCRLNWIIHDAPEMLGNYWRHLQIFFGKKRSAACHRLKTSKNSVLTHDENGQEVSGIAHVTRSAPQSALHHLLLKS